MLMQKPCPKCSGRLETGSDEDGSFIHCMMCGLLRYLPKAPPTIPVRVMEHKPAVRSATPDALEVAATVSAGRSAAQQSNAPVLVETADDSIAEASAPEEPTDEELAALEREAAETNGGLVTIAA